MIIVFFRRPILTIGLCVLAVALAGYRVGESALASLVALIGIGLLTWDVVRYFRSDSGRPEQKWEPVVDEGVVQAINGNWDAAMAEFQRALEMAGPDPRKLRAAERIGGYLESRGKTREAIPYLHEALAIRYRMFGPADGATRTLRERLSRIHMSLGDPSGAVKLLAADLEVVAPGGRVITLEGARVAAKLAEALFESGDFDGANDLSQKSIAMIEQADPFSSALVDALVVSARYALSTGDTAGAESRLTRAMQCADRAGSEDKLNVVRKGLIDLYVRSGRHTDAIPISERLLRAGTSVRKSPDMREIARMNMQHADLLDHAGRHADALKYQRIAATLERLDGSAREIRPSSSVS